MMNDTIVTVRNLSLMRGEYLAVDNVMSLLNYYQGLIQRLLGQMVRGRVP